MLAQNCQREHRAVRRQVRRTPLRLDSSRAALPSPGLPKKSSELNRALLATLLASGLSLPSPSNLEWMLL